MRDVVRVKLAAVSLQCNLNIFSSLFLGALKMVRVQRETNSKELAIPWI